MSGLETTERAPNKPTGSQQNSESTQLNLNEFSFTANASDTRDFLESARLAAPTSQGDDLLQPNLTQPEQVTPVDSQEVPSIERPLNERGLTPQDPLSAAEAVSLLDSGQNISGRYYLSRSSQNPVQISQITDREVTRAYLQQNVSDSPEYRIGGRENPLSLEMVYLHPHLLQNALAQGGSPYIREENGTVRPITSSTAEPVQRWAAQQLGLPIPDGVLRQDLNSKTYLNPYEIARTLYAAGVTGEQARVLTAVALHESGTNDGRNLSIRTADNGVSQGLFQINRVHGRPAPFDAFENARSAAAILESQGLHAWVSYSYGRHNQYLGVAQTAVQQVEQERQALQALRANRGF
jgi:hypothetical protein